MYNNCKVTEATRCMYEFGCVGPIRPNLEVDLPLWAAHTNRLEGLVSSEIYDVLLSKIGRRGRGRDRNGVGLSLDE